ncbi:MAG: hypothetical protein ACK4M6_02175 [Hyphomonas sp.]
MLAILRPKEVKDVLWHLDAIKKEFQQTLLDTSLVIQTIEHAKKSSKEIVLAVRGAEQSPKIVAWMMLLNTAESLITYTNPFIYRGTLSGRGHGYFKVWLLANSTLVELGQQTQQQADDEKSKFLKQIRNQG